ncbi:MAG: 1-deoxy-D-xylulose-5-phosphate reductoisomerase [Lentisphaeria bacterium]|nr:1-deoxy-D-xylulose-5-phosphate reductoisomerase [Lentisphaeria bacterium]
MNKKRVVVLGSTGTIGENTFRILQTLPDRFEVVGLAACTQTGRLAEQAALLGAKTVVTGSEQYRDDLARLAPAGVQVAAGTAAMAELASRPDVDIVVCAIVGTAGFQPVAEAIRHGKTIALASKEIMVMGGEWINALLKKYPAAKIVPVDSEHSAIFQCLTGRSEEEVAKLVLTASGGPFRQASLEEIRNATWEKAMQHPTWRMGAKVTIDSASMMNKALELVEARYLFRVKPEKLAVVIHPQSIVHSMVEMTDGALIAQLAPPDMRFAIQYALTFPERCDGKLPKLDWANLAPLTFEEPDHRKFPSLDFAEEALRTGGTLPTVMNAANEVAVEKFKHGEIAFPEIWSIVEKTMDAHDVRTQQDFAEIEAADREAREFAARLRG